MKTKGISIWEQHLEHMVMGAAALVLIGFAATQFMGDPNSVEVAGQGQVGPGRIDAILEEKAALIRNKIDDPAIPLAEPKPMSDTFANLLKTSITPGPTLPPLASAITPSPSAGGVMPGMPFIVPEIAAPFDLVTEQYFDTLSAETVEEHPDLKKVLPEAAPYDVTWITAAAIVDAGLVRRQFGEAGPNGESPLPLLWYNNRVDFIDVKIEREELKDGQWVASTLLEPIPGQVSVRPQLAKPIDAAMRSEILWTVSPEQGRDSLIQPEFYSGSATAWVPPDKKEDQKKPDDAAVAEDDELRELKGKLDRVQKQRDRIVAKLKELGCSEEAPPDPPKGPGAPGGPGRAGGGGGGGGGELGAGGGSGMGLRETSGANESECKKLRPQLKKLKDQITKLEAAIEKAAPAQEAPPPPVEESKEEVLPDQIMVWGHDIHVQPGKTYRYRFTIEIYNPLFLRKHELIPAQQHMSEKFTLVSKTSEWSAPRLADPPLRFFVTRAKAAAQAAGVVGMRFGSVNVEVFRFRDGRWWSAEFNNVQPGERIGGTKSLPKAGEKQVIDYSTDWFLLDVVQNTAPERDDLDRSWAATVLLHSLSDQGLSQYRQPKQDFADPERRFLRQEVKSAEAGSEVASK